MTVTEIPSSLDARLEKTFASLGDRFNRAGLLKRVGVAGAAIVGYGATAQTVRADHCGANYGRCDGCLCCGQYDGCIDETGFYCGNTPAGCFKNTGKWRACCHHVTIYDWWDCCFKANGGGCCPGTQGSPGNCTSGNCSSWCTPDASCYECSFRQIFSGSC